MIFPPNLQVRIPERMQQEGKWISTERDILSRILEAHLIKKEDEFRKKLQIYDADIATFIKKNYQEICNRRCKYIILYNTLK